MRLFTLVLLVVPALAWAQQDYPRDITLSWTNPDSYTNGAPIAAGDLDSIRVECFRQNETVPTFTSTVPDTGEGLPQSETYVAVIPGPGTYSCFAWAIVGASESDPSNEATRKYTGKPLPPQSFN